jgi:hypothetical protein
VTWGFGWVVVKVWALIPDAPRSIGDGPFLTLLAVEPILGSVVKPVSASPLCPRVGASRPVGVFRRWPGVRPRR